MCKNKKNCPFIRNLFDSIRNDKTKDGEILTEQLVKN